MRPLLGSAFFAAIGLGLAVGFGPDLARDISFRGEVVPATGTRIESARCRSTLGVAYCSVGYRDSLAGGQRSDVSVLTTGVLGGESVRLVRLGQGGPVTTDMALSQTTNRALTLGAFLLICAVFVWLGFRAARRAPATPAA